MAVEDPGMLTITCDECGDTDEVETTGYVGNPASWGVEDETLEEAGWTRIGDETFCPKCSKETENET